MAARTGRQHVIPRHHIMGRTPCNADDRNAEKERQRRDQHLIARAKDEHEDHQRQDARKRQKRIDDPHRDLINPAAAQAQINPHKPAPDHGERDGQKTHPKRLSPAK